MKTRIFMTLAALLLAFYILPLQGCYDEDSYHGPGYGYGYGYPMYYSEHWYSPRYVYHPWHDEWREHHWWRDQDNDEWREHHWWHDRDDWARGGGWRHRG